uniref:Ovule protein n=1 Tax=Panagrellus redivivus TaxID=6233 RepID=A0A7E4VCH6_PANRE
MLPELCIARHQHSQEENRDPEENHLPSNTRTTLPKNTSPTVTNEVACTIKPQESKETLPSSLLEKS